MMITIANDYINQKMPCEIICCENVCESIEWLLAYIAWRANVKWKKHENCSFQLHLIIVKNWSVTSIFRHWKAKCVDKSELEYVYISFAAMENKRAVYITIVVCIEQQHKWRRFYYSLTVFNEVQRTRMLQIMCFSLVAAILHNGVSLEV